MSRIQTIRLAYFITPHGFGHAARSCAVMEALGRLDPLIQFEIFTTVPVWFFKKSLSVPFNYHASFLVLPQDCGFYHPDLVHAVDAVIAKAGYSTIAEIYAAGVPFGYVPSVHMRETKALVAFIKTRL